MAASGMQGYRSAEDRRRLGTAASGPVWHVVLRQKARLDRGHGRGHY